MSHCVYLRKSRADAEAEARGDGETLARHERALLALAARQKLDISAVYREIVSGETIAARPVMQQLLAEVEQGAWAGVLVMEVERLARGDTIDQGIVAQTFKYAGTKIITPMKTYNPANEFDEEYFEFGLFMSRREYKAINRRLQRGRLASVNEGKYVGSKAPYGYVRRKLELQKGFTLEPHPEQAEVVRLIFEWYAQGEQCPNGTVFRPGVDIICRRLDKMAIKPMFSDHWRPSTLQNLLRNPVYAGFIRWNWRKSVKTVMNGTIQMSRPRSKPEDWILTPGLHEPLISKDIFEEARNRINSNPSHPGPTRFVIQNSLSGLIVCGECGRSMVRRPYKNGSPDTLICPRSGCPTVGSRLAAIEGYLLTALGQWLNQFQIPWQQRQFPIPPTQSLSQIRRNGITRLEKELQSLEKQQAAAYDLMEQGVYTAELFSARIRALSGRKAAVLEEIDRLKNELTDAQEDSPLPDDFISRVKHVLEVWQLASSPEEKNLLLKSLLQKAVYTKEKRIRRNDGSDSVTLTLFPKIPSSVFTDNPPAPKN